MGGSRSRCFCSRSHCCSHCSLSCSFAICWECRIPLRCHSRSNNCCCCTHHCCSFCSSYHCLCWIWLPCRIWLCCWIWLCWIRLSLWVCRSLPCYLFCLHSICWVCWIWLCCHPCYHCSCCYPRRLSKVILSNHLELSKPKSNLPVLLSIVQRT